ncbi:MAG: class I SAM-dependent methyltransferase [Brasilonema sp.]
MTTMTKNQTTIVKPIFKLGTLKQKVWKSLLSNPDSYISRKVISFYSYIEEMKWKKRLRDAGVSKVDQIFTYTNINELRALYNLASTCPQGTRSLEIGSHFGASSCYIAAGLAKVNGHLFCVDTWHNETMAEGEQDTFTDFQKNTYGVKQQITPVRKRSDAVSSQDIKVPLNFVFIDGDHSYEAVKRDFELVQQWLAKDGIIAFHDFSNPDYEGVTRVIGEALVSGKWKIAGYVDTLVWIKPATWNKPTWVK